MRKINIALIDSGTTIDCFEKVAIVVQNDKVQIKEQQKIKHLHGDTIAKIIDDKFVNIYDIQVFEENLNTSPLHIYGALEYLIQKDIDIISMSLGLTTNYQEIEKVCKKLLDKNIAIIASYPKAGQDKVYPASYEGIIRVTSDGKCEDLDISVLDDNLYGANPHSNLKGLSGSSLAVAKFTKKYSNYLAKGLDKKQILQRFKDEYKPR